jgi:Flp pilus assembly protein TadB
MTLGALCVAIACFTALHASLSPRARYMPSESDFIKASTLSPVEWRHLQRQRESWYQRWLRPAALVWANRLHLRPARIDPQYLVQAGLDPDQIDGLELRAIRLMAALAVGLVGATLAVIASGAFVLVPLFCWCGYIAPARYLAHRRRLRQDAVHRELPELVSMIRAFTSAGMPLERALHLMSSPGHADGVLRNEIRLALGRYGLGLSIEEVLQEIGPRTGTEDITMFVASLAQARRMGTGLEQTLRDQELLVRLNQRNRSTAEAARVGTKLLGVLAGIYLPEFVILIMVPLFWGIMQRAFG